MDKTINIDNMKPEEFKDFIEKVAGVGGSKLIFNQGYKYVDNVEFWKWMKDTYAKSGRFSNPDILKSAFSHLRQEKGITALIQGKGAEWDFVRNFNNNPQNQGFLIPPDQWKIAKLSKDVTGKADAYIRHIVSGSDMPVQVKNGHNG